MCLCGSLVCFCVHVFLCMCMPVCVCMCLCVHVFVLTCVCVCLYGFVCAYKSVSVPVRALPLNRSQRDVLPGDVPAPELQPESTGVLRLKPPGRGGPLRAARRTQAAQRGRERLDHTEPQDPASWRISTGGCGSVQYAKARHGSRFHRQTWV